MLIKQEKFKLCIYFWSYHTKMGEKVDFQRIYDIFKCIQVLIFIFQTSVQMKKCLKQKL